MKIISEHFARTTNKIFLLFTQCTVKGLFLFYPFIVFKITYSTSIFTIKTFCILYMKLDSVSGSCVRILSDRFDASGGHPRAWMSVCKSAIYTGDESYASHVYTSTNGISRWFCIVPVQDDVVFAHNWVSGI